MAATHANSIAETPELGIDIADGTVCAGGGATSDPAAKNVNAIATATSQHGLSSFVRPLIDTLYNQAPTTDVKIPTSDQQYWVPD